jgi:hypothetical protein
VLQAELKKPMAQPDLARQRKLDEGRNELLAPFKDKLVELCEYVFTVAIEEPEPSRDLLAFLLSLLPKEPPPEYREIKALTRVAVKLPFGEQRPWPARAAGDFLRIERLAARVEDADPRALDWMRLQYSSARKLRNDAELLFQESSPPPNLGPALEVWKKLEAAVRDISQAQETRDRMQVDLPLYVVYLESALRQDSGLVVDSLLKDRFLALDQAVDALLVLRKELDEPATSEARLEAVRKRLPELLEPFTERGAIGRLLVGADADEIKKLAGRRETGDVNDARSMEALLGLSWLTAAQRAEVWSAWRALAGRQNRLFLDRIATGLGSVNVPDGRWEARQHGLDKNRRIHGFWRAHASLSLLKLELPPTLLADLEPALRQAADLRQTPEKADLAALAGSLREFWDKARQARESRQP